jgi:cutinase
VPTFSSNAAKHIAAVVVFGDPMKGKPIKGIPSNKIDTNCFSNDMVCNGLPLPVGAHNEYYKKIPDAADWVAKTLGRIS